MEAYSDGVFSIAGTLLVLDIALNPPGTALEQVLHAWPAYLGYLISFLTIGAAWIGHSAMTDRLTHVDRSLLGINLMLLLVVAFLPFPTKLIADGLGDQNGERVFVTIYGLTLLTIRLISFLLDAYARHEHLYSAPEADDGGRGGPSGDLARPGPVRPRDRPRTSRPEGGRRPLPRARGVPRRAVPRRATAPVQPSMTSTTSPHVADAGGQRSVDNRHMTEGARIPHEFVEAAVDALTDALA